MTSEERNDSSEELLSRLLAEHNKEEFVRIIDASIDRWLDKQFARFGKWTAGGIAAILVAALTWAYVHTGGFK